MFTGCTNITAAVEPMHPGAEAGSMNEVTAGGSADRRVTLASVRWR